MTNHRHQQSHPVTTDNKLLHTNLLNGTLSIEVIDVDIHRCASHQSVVSSIVNPSIETDYILRVQSQQPNGEEEVQLETFHLSKRYLDIRNLAYALHSYAVEVVNFHARKGSSNNSRSSGGRKLWKLLEKPLEILHYTTNTESNESDLAGEFDDVVGSLNHNNNSKDEAPRRTSHLLPKSAPISIRSILEAVDEFYETVLSEKRQFGIKSNFTQVQKVAHRRRKLINGAFERFLTGLVLAGVGNVDRDEGKILPPVVDELIYGFEYFLLTDVVMEDVANGVDDKPPGAHHVNSPQAQEKESTRSIRPQSVRRRASLVEREREHEELRGSCGDLVIDDEKEDDEKVDYEDEIASRDVHSNNLQKTIVGPKAKYKSMTASGTILPQDQVTFSIMFAAGAVLFQLLQGRTVTMQLDVLVCFLASCVLIGYHMAVYFNSRREAGSKELPLSTYNDQKSQDKQANQQQEASLRPSLTEFKTSPLSTGAYNLIQTSFRRISATAASITPKQPPPKVPLKTLQPFPPGSELGSHLNCWSSPPSANFHVRGPQYLSNKKKVPSEDFLLPCRGCDLLLTDNPPCDIGRNPSLLGGKLRDVPTFIINYRLPWGVYATYHEIPSKFLPFLRRNHNYGDTTKPLPSTDDFTPAEKVLCNFFLSDDADKNAVWKIVPVVVEGPWVVKRVVGGKPALVGKQLPITYVYAPPQPQFQYAEYLEADLDIVSSAAARNILAVVRSSVQVLTIDLGFVIQGNTEEELPEQMMAGLRIHGLDPLGAEALPDLDEGFELEEGEESD